MVRLRFKGGMVATLEGGRWTTDNPLWVRKLNLMMTEYSGSPADPDPEYDAARRIAVRLGADIVDHEPLPVEHVPGRVY